MKPYYRSKGITIYNADCREVLSTLCQVDAVLTDPPYGVEFMGNAWDGVVPGPDIWSDVLSVLNPGSPLLAFGGTRTFHRLACAIEDAGFQLADTLCWLHGQGFPKGKSQLKPAWEPITLAWKKGPRVLAIDSGRIPTSDKPTGSGDRRNGSLYAQDEWTQTRMANGGNVTPETGRWPANVLLDEESAAALDQQSGILTSGNNPAKRSADKHRHVYAGWKGEQCLVHRGTDSGGASRFFYCAKASRKERGEGNTHPTVKPLKLIEYLLKLTTGCVLDPFMGSGTTLVAARNLKRKAIGIELSEKYCEIAAQRLENLTPDTCKPSPVRPKMLRAIPFKKAA